MGLIGSLLKLPLAPLTGTVWVAEQIQEQAEREYYDEGIIQGRLREIDAARQAGEIDEAEAERAEDELLERLLEGRARGVSA
jgi:cytochrome c-type biogenesis protein CcmI